MNEVGISDLEDRRTKTVLVPGAMTQEMTHHNVIHKFEHVLVMAHVFAAEKGLTRYLVIFQDSAHLREQLKKHGARFGTDFILKVRAKWYINANTTVNCHVRFSTVDFSRLFAEMRISMNFNSVDQSLAE